MDFEIVIDTREQAAYEFACASSCAKLEAGDYSVQGMTDCIAVERKSLADFVHTVIHDAARFRRELERLVTYDFACIVVEADLDGVLRGQRRDDLRDVASTALLGAALHIALHHRVPVYWCGSRQAACTFTEAFLRMAYREVMTQPLEGTS